MRIFTTYGLRQLLIRFMSSSVVHIALSATIMPPHPAVAWHFSPVGVTQQDAVRAPEAPRPLDSAEPGFGCG